MTQYHDIMTVKARHQHALECYSTTEQRARGLRQWIQMVIDEIINKDLQSITWKVSRAAHQLRVERIRLMKVNPEVSVKLDNMFIVQIIVGEEENTEMDLTFFSEENVEGANSTEYKTTIQADVGKKLPRKEDIFGPQVTALTLQYQEDNEKMH